MQNEASALPAIIDRGGTKRSQHLRPTSPCKTNPDRTRTIMIPHPGKQNEANGTTPVHAGRTKRTQVGDAPVRHGRVQNEAKRPDRRPCRRSKRSQRATGHHQSGGNKTKPTSATPTNLAVQNEPRPNPDHHDPWGTKRSQPRFCPALHLPQCQHRVQPHKGERVGDGILHLGATRNVRHHIQVTVGVRFVEIRGRRQYSIP